MAIKQRDNSTHWLVYFIIGLQIAFVAGFFIGLWLLFQDYRFSQNAIATTAKVVDIGYGTRLTTAPGMMPSTNIYPVFSFTDQYGEVQTVKPIVAMDGRFYIGETRDILFDPDNPGSRVQLVGWKFYTGMGGILLLITGPMACLFIWGVIRQKRLKEKRRLRRNQKARERRARLKAEKLALKEAASKED